MHPFYKTIKAFYQLLKNPWLLNNVLNDDTNWKKHIQSRYHFQDGLPIIQLDQLCKSHSELINTFSFLEGGSLPTDIALLKILCVRQQAASYFEIGTWRGESVSNVSEVCNECYTLNLSNQELLEMGYNQKYADQHAFYSKSNHKIVQLSGNSMSYDFLSLNKKFDIIFIDGNHHYEYVKNDTEKVMKYLAHEQSVIVWHDYAFNPEKPRNEVFAGILDGLNKSEHAYLYHVANTLCAIYIRESFKTSVLESPIKPIKNFKIRLEWENM